MFLPQMENSETRVVWGAKFAQSSFTFAFEAEGQKKKFESKNLAEPENDRKSESIKVAQISGIIPTAIKLISLHNWLLFGYFKFAWKSFSTFPFSNFLFSSRNDSKKKFLCKFRNFIHHHFSFLYRAQVSFSYRFHGWMRFSPCDCRTPSWRGNISASSIGMASPAVTVGFFHIQFKFNSLRDNTWPHFFFGHHNENWERIYW